ncbi:hypothetical protein UACE39S_06040 [Ureibacillus acetophenoni]
MAIAPIYSATKAAVHSFTMSLHHQLENTSVEVIEIAPSSEYNLGGVGLHSFATPVDEFLLNAIFKRLEEGKIEIGYARAEKAMRMNRDEINSPLRRCMPI